MSRRVHIPQGCILFTISSRNFDGDTSTLEYIMPQVMHVPFVGELARSVPGTVEVSAGGDGPAPWVELFWNNPDKPGEADLLAYIDALSVLYSCTSVSPPDERR